MKKISALLWFILFSAFLAAGFLSNVSMIPAAGAQTAGKTPAATDEEFWLKQRKKALEKRAAPTGLDPAGLVVPPELAVDVSKQNAKLKDYGESFAKPLDYADLAEKVLRRVLVELPRATETYLLEIGRAVSDAEFTGFDYDQGSTPLAADSPKMATLEKLAGDFGGEKYDLADPADRKRFKIRLLRMIDPRAKAVLEEIAAGYFKKFKRPLRVTSSIRSIEYQVELNAVNPNSLKVRDEDTFPPHASGLAFDLAYKQMTAEEQNFIMKTAAALENGGRVDATRETGANAAIHVFVYHDGQAPKL